SRSQYIYPATHDAGAVAATQTNYPAMGQRLRLKAGFVIPATWTTEEKALALGLKKYGAMVADNSSSFFSISITPDDRWPANAFNDINGGGLAITNFEVIQTTGTNEGPRSPGAPVANAGPDQTVVFGQAAQLAGVVSFSNAPPAIRWTAYSGPGTVTFGNAAQTNTTANFSAPGLYTLELSANDGVHAVAYDAVVITVTNVIQAAIAVTGTNVNVSWSGGVAPYVVQRTGALPAVSWSDIATTTGQRTNLPITNTASFFRVKGQ
ncbi:MAG: PKD domain-containing protein, partial [Limisphaerales bacterium]